MSDAADLAHRVLRGPTLADKLASDGWTWDGTLPDQPARTPSLAPGAGRIVFPGDHALHRPDAQATVLHAFATHELLALELLALALLRFHDAPAAFRHGLLSTLRDEQDHLRRYVAAMAARGMAFGDLPLSHTFWTALSPVADPAAFVAGLSMTLEAANLDFATHYAHAFRRLGVTDLADHLRAVLADEIRHVRHGVHWFDRWRPADLSRYDAWAAVLPRPLSPGRARGAVLQREPRLAAGLDDAFLDRLDADGTSRGRPPGVWTFDPGLEAAVAAGQRQTADGITEAVTHDLAHLLLLLAPPGDVVITPTPPTLPFLQQLRRAGVELAEPRPTAPLDRRLGPAQRWGPGPGDLPDPAPFYDKTFAAALLQQLPGYDGPIGVRCTSAGEVADALAPGTVAKAPFGTAGRGLRRAEAPDASAFLETTLVSQGAVLVEPWLDVVAELSVQLDVGDDDVRVHPWGRFLTSRLGQYRGAVLGRPADDLPPDARAALHAAGRATQTAARHVGEALRARGFRGPAGIDALLHRQPDGTLACKPISEINPRRTMGRVALALGRHLRAGRVGLWRHVGLRELRKGAHRTFPAWAAHLAATCPLVVGPQGIESGAVFTNDPSTARRLLTVLVVAPSLHEAETALGLPTPVRSP